MRNTLVVALVLSTAVGCAVDAAEPNAQAICADFVTHLEGCGMFPDAEACLDAPAQAEGALDLSCEELEHALASADSELASLVTVTLVASEECNREWECHRSGGCRAFQAARNLRLLSPWPGEAAPTRTIAEGGTLRPTRCGRAAGNPSDIVYLVVETGGNMFVWNAEHDFCGVSYPETGGRCEPSACGDRYFRACDASDYYTDHHTWRWTEPVPAEDSCEHTYGGTYQHRGCSRSWQCCNGAWVPGHGQCGSCICYDEGGTTGC